MKKKLCMDCIFFLCHNVRFINSTVHGLSEVSIIYLAKSKGFSMGLRYSPHHVQHYINGRTTELGENCWYAARTYTPGAGIPMESKRANLFWLLYIHAGWGAPSRELSRNLPTSFLREPKQNPNSFPDTSYFTATIFIYMLKANKMEEGVSCELAMQALDCSTKLTCTQQSSTVSLDKALLIPSVIIQENHCCTDSLSYIWLNNCLAAVVQHKHLVCI